MADNRQILDLLIEIKDDVSAIKAEVASIRTQVDVQSDVEHRLSHKVSKIERQVNMAHGAIALFALLGTIAGIVKALS